MAAPARRPILAYRSHSWTSVMLLYRRPWVTPWPARVADRRLILQSPVRCLPSVRLAGHQWGYTDHDAISKTVTETGYTDERIRKWTLRLTHRPRDQTRFILHTDACVQIYRYTVFDIFRSMHIPDPDHGLWASAEVCALMTALLVIYVSHYAFMSFKTAINSELVRLILFI